VGQSNAGHCMLQTQASVTLVTLMLNVHMQALSAALAAGCNSITTHLVYCRWQLQAHRHTNR
jgi:hypothetical protein